MTDSPFLDPNDPHYSDTPSVDEHPLEGGNVLEGMVGDPESYIAGWRDCWQRLPSLRADGYLLVSEAELAEALREMGCDCAYSEGYSFTHGDDEEFVKGLFAALGRQEASDAAS